MSARRIAIVTGTRAEYGLLAPLMRILNSDADFELRLIVTGAHLSPRFGMTVEAIEADGFAIDARVPLPLDDPSRLGTARAMAAALAGIAEALTELEPDIVVLLGDRFEMLAAAEAAFVTGRVIAHIQGGEATEGAMDDGFRHAITKLSHLHFVAAEPYRKRVIQMGEDPQHVITVGAPGLDAIAATKLLGREALADALGVRLGERYFLLTYHPVTMEASSGREELKNTLAALDAFADHQVLVTGHNADPGHGCIGALLADYAAARPDRVFMRTSLGQQRYLSAVKHAAAVIGNSSSGIIEAPALGVPTVNIGDRQKGRLRAESVIDCIGEVEAIREALCQATGSAFRERARTVRSPYGTPGASARIARVLKETPPAEIAKKRFFDLPREAPA